MASDFLCKLLWSILDMRSYIFLALISSPLFAMPQGPIVVNGKSEIHLSPAALEIVAGDQSIIEWSDFSIETGETVRFLQPNTAASVLNRVRDAYPSRLFGNLESNGQVLLINPNGVLVGKDASINTGSFIASTLDIQNDVFLSGKDLIFAGESNEAVQNMGVIRTSEGDLVLLACRIENTGSLEAPGGAVALGAASDILIVPNGTKQLFIKASASGGFLDQSGSIQASRIEMQVDGNPYQMAFQHSGSIDALGVESRDGEIYLSVPSGDVFISGPMSARNEDVGGSVEILGQRLALMEGASIDVSGKTAGGTVLVGGDYQGKNPEYQNAEMVFMDPKASIIADANERGNGGRVILWSDDGTRMYGEVSARGGALGGDGGFVEVSGKAHLDYQGIVTTLAANGNAGTLLLDPLDLTISAAASVGVSDPPPAAFTFTMPIAVGANLRNTDLTTALASNNVTVQTTGTVGPPLGGNINVNAAVSWLTSSTLTLNAARDVIINPPGFLNSSAMGAAITIDAGNNVTLDSRPISTSGVGAAITITADNDVTVQSGAATASITTAGMGAAITVNAGGDVNILANAALTSLITSNGVGSAITIHAGRNVTLTNADVANTETVTGAPITVIADQGNITLTNAGTRSCHIGSANGDILVHAGRTITLLTPTATGQGYASIGPLPGGATGPIISGDIRVEAGEDILLESFGLPGGGGGGVVIGRVENFFNLKTVDGDITVTAGRNIQLVTRGIGLNVGSFPASIGGFTNFGYNLTGTITVNAGNDLTLYSGGNSAFIGGNANGNPLFNNVQSNILVNVGGNLLMYGSGLINNQLSYIGFPIVTTGLVSTNIHVAGNIWIDGRQGGGQILRCYTSPLTVLGPNPETFIHCLGDIFIFGLDFGFAGSPSGLFNSASPAVPNNLLPNPEHTTHLWAGGSIRVINGNGTPNRQPQLLGPLINNKNNSFRAGGDFIQNQDGDNLFPIDVYSSGGTGSATGPIFSGYFVEADTRFTAGELWAAQTATVNGVNIFAGQDLGSPSPAVACDGFGAVATDTARYDLTTLPTIMVDFPPASSGILPVLTIPQYNGGQPLVFLTQTSMALGNWNLRTTDPIPPNGRPNGNLIIHSANQFAGETFRAAYAVGNAADLTIGVTPGGINRISLLTTSGNIEVSGSYGPTINCYADLSLNCPQCTAPQSPLICPRVTGSSCCNRNDSFRDISVACVSDPAVPCNLNATWTSGSIFISATRNLSVTNVPVITSGVQAVTLIADFDDDGTGNLSITQNITSAGGPISLDAGFCSAAGGTSTIDQTGGIISSGGGTVRAQAVSNINFSGAFPTTLTTGGGDLSVESTNGTIIIDEDILTGGGHATFSAGIDILVNPPGGFSVAGGSVTTGIGNMTMTARNDVTINGDMDSILTTSGAISILSDSDLSGFGNINIARNIFSTTGNITLVAGDITPCSAPGTLASVNHTAGAVSTSGNITINAGNNINLSSPASPSIETTTGFLHTQAGNNTNLLSTTIRKTGGGGSQDLLMISGRDMNMIDSHIIAYLAYVTLVVDNCFPAAPLIGLGAFNLDADSSIDPVNLRIFTALQSQNSINGVLNLNGNTFVPGTLFANTDTEHWCQYFGFPFPYPFSSLGNSPLYTIFYKICLQQVTAQAQIVVSEVLRMIDTPNFPYYGVNEYYGWPSKFIIFYDLDPPNSAYAEWPPERYFLKRRNELLVSPNQSWKDESREGEKLQNIRGKLL